MNTMLFIGEAADLLGVSHSTIHRWRREGKIKGMRKARANNAAGFVWKVPQSALEGLIPAARGKRAVNYGYGRNGKNLPIDN